MKIDLKSGFDEYAFKARVLPSFVSLSPLITISIFVGNHLKIIESILSVCASLGLIYLVSNLVRSRGKKLELKLILLWGGLPTTRMLRFGSEQNKTLFLRRRKLLEELMGNSLPSSRVEIMNPQKADVEYEAATRLLIAKIRGSKKQFPRIQEENINYGFRRNLLALKPLALTLLLVIALVACFLGINDGFSSKIFTVLLIDICFALIWLIMINQFWVKEVAESYAERLFEALEIGIK